MTRSKKTVLQSILASAALCAPFQALAETGDLIIVTANRTPMPESKVGLSVSVIGAEDIERLQTPGVTELLRTVPGMSVTRSGGAGTLSSIFVRGASSDHTVALIDGVKINDPSHTAGGFDFGRLLTGNIDRIEVVRGPQSVLWGSQAIGGVVNLITRKAEGARPSANFSAEYGYRDTVDVTGNVAAMVGPVSVSAAANWLRTDGISAFSEARGGTEKDGAKQYGANLNLGVKLTDALSADVRGWYSHSKTQLDGYSLVDFSFGDNDAHNRTREAIGYAGLNWNGLGGRWHNRIAYSVTDVRRDDYNPAASPAHQSDALGRNRRIEFQSTFDLADGWTIVAGAERERARFRLVTDYGFGAGLDSGRSTLTSFYGQITASPLVGLTVNAGARHDHHNAFGNHATVAANAAYTPNDGETILRVSYGEGFKAPSLYQLHSQYGNPALKPESAQSWDIGAVQHALDGRAQIGVTWFRRKTKNLIDFVTCADFSDPSPLCDYPFDGFYDNVAQSLSRGVEVELKLRPVDALLFDFNYSYQKPTDLTTGRDLPRRPRHKAYAGVDYRWPFGLSTGASVTHVSASNDSSFSTVRNADYVLTDIRASFPVTDRIEAYGRIENLFDETYETVFDYGQPGRAGYVGLRLKI